MYKINVQYSIQNNQCSIKNGFRQMDVQLGRWHVVDAMAEKYKSFSPYAYVGNDPINQTDLLGLEILKRPDPTGDDEVDNWLHGGGINNYLSGLTSGYNRGKGGNSLGYTYSGGQYFDSEGNVVSFTEVLVDLGGNGLLNTIYTSSEGFVSNLLETRWVQTIGVSNEKAGADDMSDTNGNRLGVIITEVTFLKEFVDLVGAPNHGLYGEVNAFWSIGAQGGWKGVFVNINSKKMHGIHYNTVTGLNLYNQKNSPHKMRSNLNFGSILFSIGIKMESEYSLSNELLNREYELSLGTSFFQMDTTFDENGNIKSSFIGLGTGFQIAAIIGVIADIKYGYKINY